MASHPSSCCSSFFFKWQKHSPKRCITEEREVGGEEWQRDLNLAARRLEGTRSTAQTKWSAAFGGFLFLHCLGLGFVLELVLGDEGCRSEAPSPSWRLSQGGIRQERGPRGLPALACSRGWSRELGSNRKTSLAWCSLLQQSPREQRSECSISGGAHAALPHPYTAAGTFRVVPFLLLLPLFSPAQREKSKRLLLALGAVHRAGRGMFSLHREQGGGTLGLSLAPIHIQLPGVFL